MGVATAGPVVSDAAGPRLGDLFEAHHRRLFRLARRLVSTSEEARDLGTRHLPSSRPGAERGAERYARRRSVAGAGAHQSLS